MPLNDIEKAYIAGFIDGEGCISLAWRLKKYTTPIIQVANTNQDILVYLKTIFGGSLIDRQEKRINRKPSFAWVVCGQKAINVIRQIYPFLKLKKNQAEILLSLKRYTDNRKRDKLGRLCGIYTDKIFQENVDVVNRIRILNRMESTLKALAKKQKRNHKLYIWSNAVEIITTDPKIGIVVGDRSLDTTDQKFIEELDIALEELEDMPFVL